MRVHESMKHPWWVNRWTAGGIHCTDDSQKVPARQPWESQHVKTIRKTNQLGKKTEHQPEPLIPKWETPWGSRLWTLKSQKHLEESAQKGFKIALRSEDVKKGIRCSLRDSIHRKNVDTPSRSLFRLRNWAGPTHAILESSAWTQVLDWWHFDYSNHQQAHAWDMLQPTGWLIGDINRAVSHWKLNQQQTSNKPAAHWKKIKKNNPKKNTYLF